MSVVPADAAAEFYVQGFRNARNAVELGFEAAT